MIAAGVLTGDDVRKALRDAGCSPTGERTDTGEFWRSATGRHFLVPDGIEDMYPNWMLADFEGIIGKLYPRMGGTVH